ncbi:MAG: hypothetical protein AVDCRST_MAG68-5149 [uncultured Gemmatimonadetes bacterium]|uniref:Uncharacterized protein n=1 Tax=uncultured Gemmatimonadota bacterium TaxID=203437 RepID=A0A6J4MV35_9BACT|nr:MAG: hypothetical protein AVDCRST_MAG68-5149 [uncultured Gemmatimonadota bacterium]
MSEFRDKPKPAALGNPETDPAFTWRIAPGARPLDLHAPRALRTPTVGIPWLVVSGDYAGDLAEHDEVRDWPYTSDIAAGAAVIAAAGRGPREGLVQPAERGDMDADAFKGGGQ